MRQKTLDGVNHKNLWKPHSWTGDNLSFRRTDTGVLRLWWRRNGSGTRVPVYYEGLEGMSLHTGTRLQSGCDQSHFIRLDYSDVVRVHTWYFGTHQEYSKRGGSVGLTLRTLTRPSVYNSHHLGAYIPQVRRLGIVPPLDGSVLLTGTSQCARSMYENHTFRRSYTPEKITSSNVRELVIWSPNQDEWSISSTQIFVLSVFLFWWELSSLPDRRRCRGVIKRER